MPWGRWVEDNADQNAEAIARQQQDSGSAGSIFASRADLIQQNIASTPSVAAVYERALPPFSVTRVFNPSAVSYVYDSQPTVFNPPRLDLPYTYTVIANMDASGVYFPFSRALIRTNGQENQTSHEILQPGTEQRAILSIVGSGNIGVGGTVEVQAAIMAQAPGTVNFSKLDLWCVFSGSIL